MLLSLQVTMEILACPIKHNGKVSAARMHYDEICSTTYAFFATRTIAYNDGSEINVQSPNP
jgi:hypothetical protein